MASHSISTLRREGAGSAAARTTAAPTSKLVSQTAVVRSGRGGIVI